MGELRRILIANRGEIAVRVIRACRELGIEAVAVVTPDEDGALHAELADDVVTVASHLDGEAVAAAGADAGADAVHPGYGYLAENPAFAEQVLRAGMTWIGPPPRAMKLLGDKIEARRLAEAAGVPVVPGYAGDRAGRRDACSPRRRGWEPRCWSRPQPAAAAGGCARWTT